MPSEPFRFGVSEIAATRAWCVERNHPLITYNPQFDISLCRCAERQLPGEQPMDWTAMRETSHSCTPGDPCTCYLPTH